MSCKGAFLFLNLFLIIGVVLSGLWLNWSKGGCLPYFRTTIEGIAPMIESGVDYVNTLRGKDKYHLYGIAAEPARQAVCLHSSHKARASITQFINKGPSRTPPRNATWTSMLDITSPHFSVFQIVNPNKSYALCDELELVIQARDGRGLPKKHGGDYFRAKVFTQAGLVTASSATDGEVVDHENGTYSAFFTLKWTGTVDVVVTLVHPSEAVDVIREFRDAAPARYVYRGKFVKRDERAMHQEETFCNVALSRTQDKLCNFTDEATGSPWFCLQPNSPALSCNDWTEHRCDTASAYKTEIPTVPQMDMKLLFPKKDLSQKRQIQVESGPGSGTAATPSQDTARPNSTDPPFCSIGSYRESLHTAGYYYNNMWYAANCKINHFSVDKIRECLSQKTMYFLGDSTIRQLFEFYLSNLAPDLQKTSSGWEPQWHVGPTHAVDLTRNTTMLFRFHGLPIGRNAWATVKDVHYIANELDSVRTHANENTVVLISLWAHFTQLSEKFYAQRIRTIMAAVRQLHVQSPSTLVVFKSANTRNHAHVNERLYHSDWLARQLDQIMREFVLQTPNTAFIDAWDMSSAQLIPDNVHPGGAHTENLSNQLLTLMCHP